MKLAFKRIGAFGFYEKDIPIIFNLGVLEAVAKFLEIEFYQINDISRDQSYDFIAALLYQGYIAACKDRYKKPKYSFAHAVIWKEYISQSAQKELLDMMDELWGQIKKTTSTMTNKKKGPARKTG